MSYTCHKTQTTPWEQRDPATRCSAKTQRAIESLQPKPTLLAIVAAPLLLVTVFAALAWGLAMLVKDHVLAFVLVLGLAALATGCEHFDKEAAILLDEVKNQRAISQPVDGATPDQKIKYEKAWDKIEAGIAHIASPDASPSPAPAK